VVALALLWFALCFVVVCVTPAFGSPQPGLWQLAGAVLLFLAPFLAGELLIWLLGSLRFGPRAVRSGAVGFGSLLPWPLWALLFLLGFRLGSALRLPWAWPSQLVRSLRF